MKAGPVSVLLSAVFLTSVPVPGTDYMLIKYLLNLQKNLLGTE